MASEAFKALDYATRMGAHIVQMSIGRAGMSSYFSPSSAPEGTQLQSEEYMIRSYYTALKPLEEKKILVVASSGVCCGGLALCFVLAKLPSHTCVISRLHHW